MKTENNHIIKETFNSIIGKHIRKSRIKSGLTQEEAAERIGCSAKHLGRIERGKKSPNSFLLSLIKINLNLNSDYFIEFREALKQFDHED